MSSSLVPLNRYFLGRALNERGQLAQARQQKRGQLEEWLADEFSKQPIKGKPRTLGQELDQYLAEMDEQLSSYRGLVQRIQREGLSQDVIDWGRREPWLRHYLIDMAEEVGIEPPK